MNRAKIVVDKLLEAEPPPEHYLSKLPPNFDAEAALEHITTDAGGYCMDNREDKRAFMAWIKENENLFPDVVKALDVIAKNDSWCTDSEDDMEMFFHALGFPRQSDVCPRCDGSGEEPGAPVEMERVALCDRCKGSGTLRPQPPIGENAADPDSPEANLERYAKAIGLKHAREDQFVLARFKKGVKAYIRWAHTDEEQGRTYDEADIRRINRAKCFAQVLRILRQYETEPKFLEMTAQGYFQ